MLYNALSMGKKTPKIARSLWDFTPPEEVNVKHSLNNKLIQTQFRHIHHHHTYTTTTTIGWKQEQKHKCN